jgi:hypothetical protein
VLPTALLLLLLVSINDGTIAQQLFLNTTYYFLMATVLCWAGMYLYAARDVRWETIVAWAKRNWPGLVVALSVTVIAGLAVEPALRMLSDEVNLVGTSKNLFASKSPTFTVSGKNYYGSYWDVDVAIDQRPTLFPFLLSLVHAAVGYSYDNVFVFNLMVLPAFLLVSYRLAKSLGGETFGLVASLLVVAHPILLISVRSGGFDFLAAFFALLVVKSLFDFARGKRSEQLAILWMNLCMFAGVRYESALFVLPVIGLLLLFKMVSWSTLRPFAFIYALTPAFLLPRIWLSLLRGSVPKQDPGTVTFSVENFLNNAYGYFQPILEPFHSFPAHSKLLIALGVVGCAAGLRWLLHRIRAGEWKAPELRFAIFVAVWMSLQAILVFTYVWGRAQYPSSARLVIPIDTFFSFAAAWILTRSLERWRPFIPVLLAAAVVAMGLPVAPQSRMLNRLTQTRENATTWRFFERLPDQRILIVTDRPNHFTIMNYGAMSFESARRDPYLFTALQRRLFQDVYVIQQIKLSTNEPLPGYELWPDRKLDPVLEFQNDADVLVRVSRVAR